MIKVDATKVGSSATKSRKLSRQRTSRQNRTPIFADPASNCKPIFGVRRQSSSDDWSASVQLANRATRESLPPASGTLALQPPLHSAAFQILGVKKQKRASSVAVRFD
jgi:hypothetical protein